MLTSQNDFQGLQDAINNANSKRHNTFGMAIAIADYISAYCGDYTEIRDAIVVALGDTRLHEEYIFTHPGHFIWALEMACSKFSDSDFDVADNDDECRYRRGLHMVLAELYEFSIPIKPPKRHQE